MDKIHHWGGLIVLGGLNKEALRLQVPPRAPTKDVKCHLGLT